MIMHVVISLREISKRANINGNFIIRTMTLIQKLSHLKKKLMGQDPPIKVQTRCKKIWYGNGYGGFYVNPDLLNSSSIVYSIGIGEDISFDLDVIKNHSSTVFGFDPTPRSLQWVNSQQFPSNFHFSAVTESVVDRFPWTIRSAIMSSICSKPTEMRTKPGVTPDLSCSSALSC